MNFYEQTSSCVSRLSPTEQNLFNYIIKNLHIVKDMSIRDLSEKCFVSTTSIFRLVKKLGYQGYAEFSQALRDTEEESRKNLHHNYSRNHRYCRQLPRQLSEKRDRGGKGHYGRKNQ